MPMKTNSVQTLLSTFLNDTRATKRAEEEAGATEPATTGEHAADNSAKVKADVGPTSVDSTAPNHSGPSAPNGSLEPNQAGLKATPSGEDQPAVQETQKDPGTAHGARTDNEKISAAGALARGNALLAKIAGCMSAGHGKPTVSTATKKVETTQVKAAATDSKSVTLSAEKYDELVKAAAMGQARAGWEVGSALTANADRGTKQAEDKLAAHVSGVHAEASLAGQNLADFLAGMAKAAEDMMSPEEAAALEAAMAGAGGDAGGATPPADGSGADPATGAVDPAMIEALVQELAAAGITPEQLTGEAGGDAAGENPDAGAIEMSSGGSADNSGEAGSDAPAPESAEGSEGSEGSEPAAEEDEEKSAAVKAVARALVAELRKQASAQAPKVTRAKPQPKVASAKGKPSPKRPARR